MNHEQLMKQTRVPQTIHELTRQLLRASTPEERVCIENKIQYRARQLAKLSKVYTNMGCASPHAQIARHNHDND